MSLRLRLLRTTLDQPHRYRGYRLAGQLSSLIVLAAVPLLGIARFDLWDGRHMWLGERVSAMAGAFGFIVAVGAFYGVTFAVNVVAARTFCGWACPVGQLHRFGDELRAGRGGVRLALWSVAVAGAGALWLADPALIAEGSWRARGIALAASGAVAGVLALHAATWRWGFCRKACPIGLYYSVVHGYRPMSILYTDRDVCGRCTACASICPVGLDPRRLGDPIRDIGGLSIDGMPGFHHCLHCGACVEICEHVRRKSPAPAPLAFGRLPRAARAQRRDGIHVAVGAVAIEGGDQEQRAAGGVEDRDAGRLGERRAGVGDRDAGVDREEQEAHELHDADADALPPHGRREQGEREQQVPRGHVDSHLVRPRVGERVGLAQVQVAGHEARRGAGERLDRVDPGAAAGRGAQPVLARSGGAGGGDGDGVIDEAHVDGDAVDRAGHTALQLVAGGGGDDLGAVHDQAAAAEAVVALEHGARPAGQRQAEGDRQIGHGGIALQVVCLPGGRGTAQPLRAGDGARTENELSARNAVGVPASALQTRPRVSREREVPGSGLSYVQFGGLLAFSVALFLLWGGPLWSAGPEASHVGRFAVSYLAVAPVASLLLVWVRRFSLGHLLTTLGEVWAIKLVVTSIMYTALATGTRAEQRAVLPEAPSAQVADGGAEYTPAMGAFSSSTVRGVATRAGSPAASAIVFLQHPPPGAPLPEGRELVMQIRGGAYAQPVYAVTTADTLAVANDDDRLYTVHLHGADASSNQPVPAGMRRDLTIPEPGVYRVSSDGAVGASTWLVVVDHPYVAIADPAGAFELASVPYGATEIVGAVVDGGQLYSATVALDVHADESKVSLELVASN